MTCIRMKKILPNFFENWIEIEFEELRKKKFGMYFQSNKILIAIKSVHNMYLSSLCSSIWFKVDQKENYGDNRRKKNQVQGNLINL